MLFTKETTPYSFCYSLMTIFLLKITDKKVFLYYIFLAFLPFLKYIFSGKGRCFNKIFCLYAFWADLPKYFICSGSYPCHRPHWTGHSQLHGLAICNTVVVLCCFSGFSTLQDCNVLLCCENSSQTPATSKALQDSQGFLVTYAA